MEHRKGIIVLLGAVAVLMLLVSFLLTLSDSLEPTAGSGSAAFDPSGDVPSEIDAIGRYGDPTVGFPAANGAIPYYLAPAMGESASELTPSPGSPERHEAALEEWIELFRERMEVARRTLERYQERAEIEADEVSSREMAAPQAP